MRLALLTPLPPAQSGIADYSAELAPALARLCDLTVYAPQPANGLPWQPIATFRGPAGAHGWDIALYQIGNNLDHEPVYRHALQWPGVVVLHDPIIHHFVAAITERRGEGGSYLREMLYSHGAAGGQAARVALRGQQGVDAARWPLTGRLIDASLGVVVHSEAAAAIVRQVRPEAPVTVIPHLVAPPPRLSRARARQALGLPAEPLLIGVFGLVTPAKQLDAVVLALNDLADQLPDWRLVVVGEDGGALAAALEQATAVVRPRILMLGRLPWPDFRRALAAVDLVVALRWPTLGETSGVALRALAAGTPLIASATGAFRELPVDAVTLIPPNDPAALRAALAALASDPTLRRQRGEAGRRWAAATLAPPVVARQYLAALEAALHSG
jgi:glycosyltransferase involved in cell wall biosynthesis